MPALEIAQETGKLVAWLKKDGDPVSKGEPLLEVETDKAVLEVEALADGVLGGVSAEPGSVIPVGQTIAWILAPGEAVPAATLPVVVEPTPVEARPAERVADSRGTGPRISPKARRLAREHNLNLATVRGSGADGEILASDIQTLIDQAGQDHAGQDHAGQATALAAAPIHEQSSIGRLMAERTTASWTTVPHFFLLREIDATALNAIRASVGPGVERAVQVKLTHTDLLIALVARTLLHHPLVNASWIENQVRLNPEVKIAIAMAVSDGVVAAVIPDAATAGLSEIASHRRDLTERARAGRLRPGDVANATFTISNLGMFHVDSFSAIITPPQAAILAVGCIADRVVAVDGVMSVRPMLSLTLSSDHRVLDGAKAAMFMQDLAEALHHPETHLG